MRKTIPLLLASAAVALPLAIAGSARAADPAGPDIVLYDAAGTPVAVLRPIAAPEAAGPGPALGTVRHIEAAMRPDFPGPFFPAEFFARQDAMLQRLMQQMQSLAAAPMPAPGMIEAALGAVPGTASQVVVSSFSSGKGTCGESVAYIDPGNGGAPEIAVRRVGDACGAVGPSPMQSVPAAQPVPAAPQQVAPAPDGTQLIGVDYTHPAHPPRRLHG